MTALLKVKNDLLLNMFKGSRNLACHVRCQYSV